MDDINTEMDLLTRRTEEMLWGSLPERISLHMDLAAPISGTVLIGKIIGLKLPGKSIIINTILVVWKFSIDLKIEAMENSTYLFHFSRSMDKYKYCNWLYGILRVTSLCSIIARLL